MKYEHAREILKKHRDKLFKDAKHAHFVSVEKDGDKLIVNIYVTKKHTSHNKVKKQKLKLKAADPEALDIKVTVSGPITAFAARTDKWRPAPGGVSIGHYNITAGTLGCTVYKNATKYILSNNHILADCNDGEIEDAIYQPGPYDGGTVNDKIGELFEYVTLLWGGGTNTVDCALCLPDLAADVDDVIIDLEYPTAIEEPTIGNAVVKSGRTTGIKEGTISGIGDGWVNYGSGRHAWFEDQIVITNISAGGDSGSLIVDKDSGTAIGLLFAGSSTVTIANKMTEVADELNITLLNQQLVDNEAVVNLSCSVVSDPVAAKVFADQATVDLSNSVAVEVGTGKPIADGAVVNLSASCLLEKITPVVITCSAMAYLSALTTNYGYAHYGPNNLAGLYRVADDSLEKYELYRGQDDEPDFDADPWETFSTLPHTSGVVMDTDLRANCVARCKMNDKAYSPYIASLNGIPTELVTEPLFDNLGAGWIFGGNWSYSAGGAIHAGADAGSLEPTPGISVTAGKKYAVFYRLVTRTSGGIVCSVGGVEGAIPIVAGSYWQIITAGNSDNLKFYVSDYYGDFTGKIDNVFCFCLDDFPNTGYFMDGGDCFTNDHSVTGKLNAALRLVRASSHYIDYGMGPNIVGTGVFAFALWFRLVTLGTPHQYLIQQRSTATNIGSWGAWYNYVTDKIQFYVYNAGYGFNLASDTAITDSNWHLVLGQRINATNGELYLDNNLVASGSGPAKALADVQVVLGKANSGAGSSFLDGEVDVVGIWDGRFLSQAERDWIWNGGSGREGLVEAKTYHFATRKRNKFNLISQNIATWDLEVDEDGNVLYNPAAPQNISITPAASAKALVKAQYIYDPDISNTATKWLIYFTDDGTDPDPDSDTPTEVTMYKANGIAHLNWLSPAADHNDTLKVLVRTRVTINGTDYDSQNTTIYSCTANDTGPAAPTGRVFFDKVAEAM